MPTLTLTITWPAGKRTVEPPCKRNGVGCDVKCADCEFAQETVRYSGQGPTAHPAFKGARLIDGYYVWSVTSDQMRKNGMLSSRRALEAYGTDKLRHLRSWGITGTMTVA